MEHLGQHGIDELLASIASDSIAPAAGTSIAVAGAFGFAQLEMAAIHLDTTNLDDHREQLRDDRERMLDLGARDATFVDDAFGSTDDITEDMYHQLADIPITTAEVALSGLQSGLDLIDERDEPAVPDAICGLWLLRSVLSAAGMIARINLPYVTDETDQEQMADRIERVEDVSGSCIEAIEARTADIS